MHDGRTAYTRPSRVGMTIPNSDSLFTPGTSLDAAPSGDAERQAVASLGGYAYQVAVSTLAWLDLPEAGRIFLEVAEDYAIVASQALSAVQVKDTAGSGSVTLNTESVREAVEAFVDLVARNPRRNVELRYLTTSGSATEHKLEDRPSGEAGLLYWRKAASGADVAPLRKILTTEKFSMAVRDFVKARDDNALRRDLLQRIHWDCGKPDLSAVTRELQERLIVFGRDHYRLPAMEAQRLADTLMHHVLKKSILSTPEQRMLTRAELYGTIDVATRVSVPRAAIDSIAQVAVALSSALTGGPVPDVAFSAGEVGWLTASGDLPPSRTTIARRSIEGGVVELLGQHSASILVAGSGLGKSLVARAAAQRHAASFVIVDLRDLQAAETRSRLDFLFARVGAISAPVMIFEDLNHFEDPGVRLSFARIL